MTRRKSMFSNFFIVIFRCRDSVRVYRGGHVCDPLPSEGGHGKGLLGRRQQGHQGLRQVLRNSQVHDLQLERTGESRYYHLI